MQDAVIMDQLSEFLMVEQGGLELYRIAAARSKDAQDRDADHPLGGCHRPQQKKE